MTILLAVLLWLMIGDLLASLRRWDSDDPTYEVWVRVVWPIKVWGVLTTVIADWRQDLYRRVKY